MSRIKKYPFEYDVIVIGAGHAGCEAALASARMGGKTLLVTMDADTIAKMSCNPAIGGLAKGHIVREIDALGGEMGRVIDETGIHFRMLNKAKGPAVWAPRAQADKKRYHIVMKHVLEKQKGLDLLQGKISELIVSNNKVVGVRTYNGYSITGKSVIVTSGTFLRGLIHIGQISYSGGRAGEESSEGLSLSLSKAGLELGRLKTGTPARIFKDSIDYGKVEVQDPDPNPRPFSYWTDSFAPKQIPCYITYTNEKTHKIISQNIKKSPMYSGRIKSTGVRYCPSIEDKVVKFPDKNRHQIFLEPEGIETEEVYLNGASTSLPEDVQLKMYSSIDGLQNVRILRFAYAIEYDYVNPLQIKPNLETKVCKNLFLAGQINGTTGYEEAGAQGLMAGINAVLKIRGETPFVLKRSEAYIGVLIDDLTTKGTLEPYRMFTSRAEYRLLLRQDNADMRLTDYGYNLGIIDKDRYALFSEKKEKIKKQIDYLKSTNTEKGILYQLLKRPEINYKDIIKLSAKENTVSREIEEAITFEVKYEGYIKKQHELVKKMLKMEEAILPQNVNYFDISGLRKEAQGKLNLIKPMTLGQAQRISGVNPADIAVLMIYLKKFQNT